MKKLLGIIVLGLLLGGNVFAGTSPLFSLGPYFKDGKMIRNGIAQQKAIMKREFRRVKILLLASGKLNVIHLKRL